MMWKGLSLAFDFLTGLLLVAISLFSALTAVFLLGRQYGQPKPAPGPALADIPNKTIFVFTDTVLTDATPPALLLVGAPVDRNDVWEKLLGRLNCTFPGAKALLVALAEHHTEFDLPGDNAELLTGRCEKGRIRIEIAPLMSNQTPVSVEQAALKDQVRELATLREVAELSPMLAWRQSTDGSITWANQTYLNMMQSVFPGQTELSPPYRVIFEASDVGQTTPTRRSLTLPGNSAPLWFEVKSMPSKDQQRLNFAFHADPVVQAEQALRNFVQTLTKTFAHLPIGLAIFDRNRQLALFNPALADLTTLEPVWLTARPTLTAFLDRLRECRHVPEPKNYKTWRDRISALEKAAEDGTYEENWPLPTGQTYKVTGRPHPEGAVAFLFEDITSAISLQRQFRSELEVGQSILDSLTGAIAVFSASGELTMSNDSFSTLWGVEPREMLGQMSVTEAVGIWQSACEPSRVWGDLLAFADNSRERIKWGGQVRLKTGAKLEVEVRPLSRGAILCEFTPNPPSVLRKDPQEGRKSLAGV